MAAGFSASMLGTGATAMAARVTHIQTHTGDPGASGTSNTTAAARVAGGLTATGTSLGLTSTPIHFTGGAASGACSWVSFWTAITGGTWLGNFQITSGDTTFNAAGEFDLTAVAITGS